MDKKTSSGRRTFMTMGIFVLLGIPFVAVLWETLNDLLALDFSARLWIAVPAAALLGVVLYMLARSFGNDSSDTLDSSI